MDILEETASCIRAPLDEEPRHLSYLRLYYTVGYGAEINMIHGQSNLFKPLYFDYKMGGWWRPSHQDMGFCRMWPVQWEGFQNSRRPTLCWTCCNWPPRARSTWWETWNRFYVFILSWLLLHHRWWLCMGVFNEPGYTKAVSMKKNLESKGDNRKWNLNNTLLQPWPHIRPPW